MMAWLDGLHNASLAHHFTAGWSSITDNMPSVRSLSGFALSALGGAQSALGLKSPFARHTGFELGASATCTNTQLSCHNTTVQENLCCFNSPGGSLLQTQFWDTSPVAGPSDSWTIHGLWVCIEFPATTPDTLC